MQPLAWNGRVLMIISAQFVLRKHRQTNRHAPQPSLSQKSETPQGKVQREVNIYHNGPRRKNKSSPIATDVFSKMPESESVYTPASCCCLIISLYGRKSALQNIIWQINQFVADTQKWVLLCSADAEENSVQKPINSSDFKQLLTLFDSKISGLFYLTIIRVKMNSM